MSRTEELDKHHHFEEGIKLIFRGLVPLVLLLSGVWILSLDLSFYNLFIGVPLTIIGAVFLIYTYDEVISKKTRPDVEHIVPCSVCGLPTPSLPGIPEKDVICFSCKKDISRGIRKTSP